MPVEPVFLKNSILSRCIVLLGALSICGTATSISVADGSNDSAEYSLIQIMEPLTVSGSQKIAQQSPIASYRGNVYVVNIESGESGDTNGVDLHTVIRRGEVNSSDQWSWSETTLETRTIHDSWHTSPAVGIDNSGYVHVAYNMHNMPWQYSVSDQTDSIDSFTFAGDEISLDDIKTVKFDNRTSFKTNGYAAIPGNQITYPAFYNNTAGDLFISYRFAAKPAQSFENRTMSAGIASFDNAQRTWQATGGDLDSEKNDYETSWFKKDKEPLAIASQEGWTAYHPRLAFDGSKAFVFFYWREGVAGETLVKPCVITTKNFQQFSTLKGDAVNMPVKATDCSNIAALNQNEVQYNTIGSMSADSQGTLYLLLSPTSGNRSLLTYRQGVWSSENAPNQATEVFVDQHDNLWAISTGLNVYRKSAKDNLWEHLVNTNDRTLCYPRASLNENKSVAFVYSQSCDDSNTVMVHKINLISN